MNLVFAIALVIPFTQTYTQSATFLPDAILGKWISDEKNIIVEVYKENNSYKGRLFWFKNSNERTRPSDTWKDVNNPDKTLRNRKLLGMEVLQNLVYNKSENRWEEGKIYDSTTGKTWSSSAKISNNGVLEVRGFWHFEFLGRTMLFKKL